MTANFIGGGNRSTGRKHRGHRGRDRVVGVNPATIQSLPVKRMLTKDIACNKIMSKIHILCGL